MAFSKETFESMVKALALPSGVYHMVFVTGLGTKADVLVKVIKQRVQVRPKPVLPGQLYGWCNLKGNDIYYARKNGKRVTIEDTEFIEKHFNNPATHYICFPTRY